VTSLPVSIGPNQSIKILNADGSISSLASIGAHLGTAFTIPADIQYDPLLKLFSILLIPDPNWIFHFNADPDPDRTPSFTHVGKSIFLLTYI
jgi:hypothetical protein